MSTILDVYKERYPVLKERWPKTISVVNGKPELVDYCPQSRLRDFPLRERQSLLDSVGRMFMPEIKKLSTDGAVARDEIKLGFAAGLTGSGKTAFLQELPLALPNTPTLQKIRLFHNAPAFVVPLDFNGGGDKFDKMRDGVDGRKNLAMRIRCNGLHGLSYNELSSVDFEALSNHPRAVAKALTDVIAKLRSLATPQIPESEWITLYVLVDEWQVRCSMLL